MPKYTGKKYIRTTFTVYKDEWEFLNKYCAPYYKGVSKMVAEAAIKYDGIPPMRQKPEFYEVAMKKPFCFESEDFKRLSAKAEEAGMKRTQYVISCALSTFGYPRRPE